MDRTTAANYATIAGKRAFQNANPGAGVSVGTGVSAIDAQAWQEELMAVIEQSGQTGNAAVLNLVFQGILRFTGGNNSYVSASATLVLAQMGMVQVNAAAGNITLTLPAAASLPGLSPFGYLIARLDTSGNTVTVVDTGSDGDAGDGTTGETMLTIPPRCSVWIKPDGVGSWYVVSQTSATPSQLAAEMARAMAAEGTKAALAGSATQVFNVANATAASEAVALGQFLPPGGYANLVTASGGSSATATVSITVSGPGALFAWGARNNSSEDTGTGTGTLYLNGTAVATDTTKLSMAHFGSGTTTGGAVTASYTAYATPAFSVSVLLVFIPTI